MARSGRIGRVRDAVAASLRGGRGQGAPAGSGGGPRRRRRGHQDGPGGAAGAGAGPERPITVSYAPERDGDADPGEVVWTWVPYEDDPTRGKDRPVLVLGHDGDLLAGVPLSSRDHTGRHDEHEWVPVGSGAWDRTGRPSHADASRLLRIRPGDVRREGAALPRDRFDEVLACVTRLHDWNP